MSLKLLLYMYIDLNKFGQIMGKYFKRLQQTIHLLLRLSTKSCTCLEGPDMPGLQHLVFS
jgi:hypothetical protein